MIVLHIFQENLSSWIKWKYFQDAWQCPAITRNNYILGFTKMEFEIYKLLVVLMCVIVHSFLNEHCLHFPGQLSSWIVKQTLPGRQAKSNHYSGGLHLGVYSK